MKFKKYQSKFNVEYILNLNKEGKNIREISKIIKIPEKRLSDMLNYYKIKLVKGFTHPINHTFFDNIDSEIKAYLLGYLVADGCVSIEKRNNGNYSYRIVFNVSIDDLDVIKLIQYYICPSVNIRYYHNTSGASNRKPQCSIKFTSKHMVNTLINKYNIVNNKTYNINYDMLDLGDYNIDFIRGFFDGDGTIGKDSFGFISTSKLFLQSILNIISSHINNITYRIYTENGKTVKYHRLLINTGKGIENKIYKLLYDDKKYYLNRKKIKFNMSNTELTK